MTARWLPPLTSLSLPLVQPLMSILILVFFLIHLFIIVVSDARIVSFPRDGRNLLSLTSDYISRQIFLPARNLPHLCCPSLSVGAMMFCFLFFRSSVSVIKNLNTGLSCSSVVLNKVLRLVSLANDYV